MISLERHVTHVEHTDIVKVQNVLINVVKDYADLSSGRKQLLSLYIRGYLLVKGSAYWASYVKAPQYKVARFIPLIGTMVNSAQECEYAGTKVLEEAEDLASIRRDQDDYRLRNLANHLTSLVIMDGDDNKVSLEKLKEAGRISKIINFIDNWSQANDSKN